MRGCRARRRARLWGALAAVVDRGLLQGQRELNETRERLGLAPLEHVHGGISRELALVATFPQLEYPRPEAPAPNTHVVGPLQWEPPTATSSCRRATNRSCSSRRRPRRTPGQELLRAALHGLADLPVRVLGTWNRRPPTAPLPAPANARVVEWLSYARTMPRCAVVVCHAGHGTVMRALTSGCAVVAVPAAGDMNENAARLDWAGARRPAAAPPGLGARDLRLAVGARAGRPRAARARAELAAWAAAPDPQTARRSSSSPSFCRR